MMRGPTCAMASRTDWSKPRMSAVMPTIDVMPMTTPRTVRPERNLFVRTVSNAIVTTSQRSPNRIAIKILNAQVERCSFPPQRLDRIQARGPARGIQAEEQSHRRRDADAERDRPDFDGCRDRRKRRDCERDDEPET